jgi:hypothetical protein
MKKLEKFFTVEYNLNFSVNSKFYLRGAIHKDASQ